MPGSMNRITIKFVSGLKIMINRFYKLKQKMPRTMNRITIEFLSGLKIMMHRFYKLKQKMLKTINRITVNSCLDSSPRCTAFQG